LVSLLFFFLATFLGIWTSKSFTVVTIFSFTNNDRFLNARLKVFCTQVDSFVLIDINCGRDYDHSASLLVLSMSADITRLLQ